MAISNELVSLANSLVAVKEACNEALEAKGASAVNCLDEIAPAIESIQGGGGIEEPQFYVELAANGGAILIKLGDRKKPYASGNSLDKFSDAFSLIGLDTDVVLYINVRGPAQIDPFVDNLVALINDYAIDVDRLTVYGAYAYTNKVYYWGEIDVGATIAADEIVWVAGSRDDEKGVVPASEEA